MDKNKVNKNKEQEENRKEYLRSILSIASKPEGVLVLRMLVQRCGVFSKYKGANDNYVALGEFIGKRDYGLDLMTEISEALDGQSGLLAQIFNKK